MRTLVTFGVKAYNQIAYIKEALDGAFAQTYRPLEIVISDDASTDGTWESIEERVARERVVHSEEIRSGELTIVASRNRQNLGNVKNFERIGALAQGEIVVKADGDDVSRPDRAARIVEAWERDGRRAKVITHAVETLGEGRMITGHNARRPLGAGMAWTRDVFAGWPEIGEDCRRSFDDVIYSARALLLGPELVMEEVLVDYRVGSGETSAADPRCFYARGIEGVLAAEGQKKRDLKWARETGVVDACREERERGEIEKEVETYGAYYALFASENWFERVKAFRRVMGDFNWKGKMMFATYLLPGALGGGARRILNGVKRGLGK